MSSDQSTKRQTSTGDDPLYRPREAAGYVLLAESTLAKRRLRGDPPEFLKVGPRLVAYRKSALDRFLADCRRTSTSDPGPKDESTRPAGKVQIVDAAERQTHPRSARGVLAENDDEGDEFLDARKRNSTSETPEVQS